MTKEPSKIPTKEILIENEFFPAPGGEGSINVQPGWGTFASPEVSQNPDNFYKRFADYSQKSVDGYGNLRKDSPDSGSMERDLNKIYSKRDTPTPDDIVAGLKYEIGHQIKKDRLKAKELVLINLKKDPHYYTQLKMLNIDDKTMMDNMSENKKHPNDSPKREKIVTNVSETKRIFEDLSKEKDNKFAVNSKIVDVMNEMWAEKRRRNAWKNGQSQ